MNIPMSKAEERRAVKFEAQDALMHAAQLAFDDLTRRQLNGSHDSKLRTALDQQFKRMEKLFGYVVGSWARGS